MNRRRLSLYTAALLVWAAAWATHAGEWRVDGPVSGPLKLTASSPGRVNGTLGGVPVNGFLVHRHLVILRLTDDIPQLWTGWLSDDASRIAGTVTLPGGEQQPWSAARLDTPDGTVVVPLANRASPTPPPPRATPTPVRSASPSPAVAPGPETTIRITSEPAVPTGTPWLEGRWQTPTGVAVFHQDGRRLELTLPDGRTVGGRITGTASLVAGLRLGCCRGALEGMDRIRWEDDAVWLRQH